MRVFFITFLILFGISTQNVYAACTKADSTPGCDAGKYCDDSNQSNPVCMGCPDKFYCPGGTNAIKTACGDDWDGSVSPRSTRNNCYKNCPTKNESSDPKFENGTWKPASATINYPTTTCSYPVENITCNNANNKCNGFHVENQKCISNIQDCSASKNAAITGVRFNYTGKKVYDPAINDYSSCYITECPSDRHSENMGTICGFQYANDCAANRGNCRDKLGNCTDGNITGQYSWVNEYRYDDCRCESDKFVAGEGTYLNSCKLTNNKTGDNSDWGNCEHSQVKSCVTTKCQANPGNILCVSSPKGYYSGENEVACHPCPAGSTNDGGKSKIDDCYISSATQFRDKLTGENKFFKLPIDNINYK